MRRFAGLLLVSSPLLVGCASARHCRLDARPPAAAVEEHHAPDPIEKYCPVPDPDYRPTNLVFQGGGVKGIAYGGALRVLEQQEILPSVERVAGTSAGAITATLVALRFTPHEVKDLMLRTRFTCFEDGGRGGVFRLFRRYGWYKGDYFLNLMRQQVMKKTGDPGTTFLELKNATDEDGKKKFRELRLFTTDLNTGSIQELSACKTPDLEVALAARMSMSIPLFFASIEHASFPHAKHPGERIFVDGGVLYNYPIGTFDDEDHCKPKKRPGDEALHPRPARRLNPATLGFVLLDTEDQEPPTIDDLLSYSRALVHALLNVQVAELQVDRPNLARTAVLDDLGIPTTDFELSRATKHKLLRSGERCTCLFLKERQDYKVADLLMTPLPPGELVPLENFDECGWVLDGEVGLVE